MGLFVHRWDLDERNVTRSWYRVRRQAAKLGVRPLKLHAARHTYASLALAAGKSIRWVAAQLGHASAAFTLRTYAHAMPEEEVDLSFADFNHGTPQGVSLRLCPSPQTKEGLARDANPSDLVVELGGSNPRPQDCQDERSPRKNAGLRHVAQQGPARGCTVL